MHFDDDKDVLEMGPDASRSKRKCSGLLEDNGHNVISDMPFPQKLQSGKGTHTELQTRFSVKTKYSNIYNLLLCPFSRIDSESKSHSQKVTAPQGDTAKAGWAASETFMERQA